MRKFIVKIISRRNSQNFWYFECDAYNARDAEEQALQDMVSYEIIDGVFEEVRFQ